MTAHHLRGGWAIWTSVLVALLLSITPLPQSLNAFRPLWVSLVFIYWSLFLPHRVSMVAAFIFGVLLDVMVNSLLGQNALVLVLTVYISLLFQHKIRPQPIVRQTIMVSVILILGQLIQLWIYVLTGIYPSNFSIFDYIFPIITSAIMWPWLSAALRALRIRIGIN
ncbi:rod shape-determining protein MreD [Entomomonas sp. E2T0]|uniref:rod shape-determining protein MreD n=1 Tax=Entomomonas sp. E2T0 TaxID=2930213 RepID=UPI0022282E0A|nr:rod shape-determining protein MreD [Entomomonas sp. E2T0]UYZ84152.1 rod shape-determining protein MreD [Entomomonas sp. E2T0]